MKTNTQITHIFLERDDEDRALLIEIHQIISDLKIESIKDFIKKYPLIYKLKNNLKLELDLLDGV